ncbi:MAG: NUDIX hydrolase [Clostridia bacterium]|nr:NUDIX hydrolase [Clostridia bacterium]
MREDVLKKLNQVIQKFSVKSVRDIERAENDKFIKSVAREYTLNSGDKICREEILKGGVNGSAVIIVPVLGDKILTVVEPRVFTKLTVGVGFPAGYVNPNETPEASAIRELEEETGYTASKLIKLDEFYQDEGCSSALNTIYLALNCKKKCEQHLDKDEYIEYIAFDYDELVELEQKGYIMGANSKLAILRMGKYFERK